MKKKYIVWAVVALVVIVLIALPWTSYNNMVTSQETVTTAWSNVESQYQRRADLIPNLVNTVKGYATHERSTLESVMQARARATQVTVDPTQLTPEKLQQYQSALGRLMMVAENYPNLKANENFSELQAQLEGTENRINESRRIYNEAVQAYNVGIRRFPAVIFARLFGFDPQAKFEANEGADQAPKVEF